MLFIGGAVIGTQTRGARRSRSAAYSSILVAAAAQSVRWRSSVVASTAQILARAYGIFRVARLAFSE
jgi:hypothetical protein